jgi:ribosome-associated protein
LSIAKAGLVEKPISSSELNDVIVDCIQDIKGKRIVKLDLTEIEESSADYFIVCEGESTTQVKAISNNICKRIKDEYGLYPNHVEGIEGAQWILVDYFDIIVHIFHPEKRSYYDIEELWSDAKYTAFEDL